MAKKGEIINLQTPVAKTATFNSDTVDVSDFTGVLLVNLNSALGTGTTPTMDVKLQSSTDVGLSLSNATYDHTGNGEGERHLASTGAFADYTFTAGDVINLSGAAGGVAAGSYEIASRVDDDAILLTDHPGLTADSTTDVDSEAPTDITGATFTQVTDAADVSETIEVRIDSAKQQIRAVATIAGTTPSFTYSIVAHGFKQYE